MDERWMREALLQAALDAGAGDDVFVVNADSVKPLYAKGYFYDLSGLPVYQELNDAAKAQSTIGDIAYCIPADMTAYGLFVNLDILAQYGLKAPENLEEFLNCCRVIQRHGGTPICLNRWFALTVPTMANGLYQVYGAENRQKLLLGLNNGELKVGDTMLEGFRVFQEFVQNGWYGDGLDGAAVDTVKAGDQDYPAFAAGERAFLFASLGSVTRFERESAGFDFQVQGVPVPGGTVTLPAVSSRLCVNADSPHLEQALAFVTYLTSGTYSGTAANGSGYLPIYDTPDFTLRSEKIRPAYKTFLTGGQIPIEDMQLSFTYWDTVRELCIRMFDGMTPEEAAAEYNRIQAEQIAAYRS